MRTDRAPASREMAERIHAFDWAATELGPVATWPATLATIVDTLIASPCPMLLWCGERSIQIYNDAAARDMFGDPHARALGAPADESWGRAWHELEPAVASVRSGGAAAVRDITLDDGRSWSVSLSSVRDASGGFGGVLAIVRETTTSASFIEVFRNHLRSLFMYAPAPIVVLRGPQYIVELANEAMANAFERKLEDVQGRAVFEVVPEIRELFEPLLRAVIASGQSKLVKELQYRTVKAADGTSRGYYANGLFAPLTDLHGNIEGVLVIAVEITDEVRARDEMRRLRGVAEAANRAKDEFLAILGHELRNPLSPILTALQVMRMRGITGREIDVLDRQVGHLTRLVDDLLDVSRAISGKVELHRQHIEIADVVAEALELSSPLLEQRRHVVDVDVPRHGLRVHVDRERMLQVVSNLLTNAAKYSEPGSHITIRGARTNGAVRLAVRDRGAGIAPEMLKRVFEPFVQQAQTIDRALGGLGLGLSIVRSLVEQHGGKVSAASDGVGLGSEFSIELPSSAETSDVSQSSSSEVVAERPPAPRKKILVVDDNEDSAMMLGDALERLGYQVLVAHDGPSALRIAAGFAPDLALLDLGLPVMDGFELAERLREQQSVSQRPHLVAVTGYGQDSDRQRSDQAGFERHLVKPVSLRDLSRVVEELVP